MLEYSSINIQALKCSVDDTLLAVACTTIQTELPAELTKSSQLPASAAARAACSALLHCYLLRARSSKSAHIPISRRAIHTRIIIYPRSLVSIPTSYFYSNSPRVERDGGLMTCTPRHIINNCTTCCCSEYPFWNTAYIGIGSNSFFKIHGNRGYTSLMFGNASLQQHSQMKRNKIFSDSISAFFSDSVMSVCYAVE